MERFLKNNSNVYTWSKTKIPGIFPFLISHSLNVNPMVKPVKKKKRKFASDRVEAVKQETKKLLNADFIREVHYPD